VSENITYAFSGTFQGAWRDIPSRFGERVDQSSVAVYEGGRRYRPGGTIELGTPGPVDSFSVGPYAGGTRIVWRYAATDEERTFTVSYRMTGLIKVYADTADLNLRVWGDQWTVPLAHLQVQISIPRVPASEQDRFRVWGHPREVNGRVWRATSLDAVALEATDVPAQRWVELRTIFPPNVLASTSGAQLGGDPGGASFTGSSDNAFDTILAQENAADAAERTRDERVARLRHSLPWLIPVFLVLLFAPALLAFFWIARTFGRDRVTDPVEYVHEPPSDDSPALVGALMREGGTASEREFLGTFFDLIRRGYFASAHETTVRKHLLGHDEVISDLRIKKTNRTPDDLATWDRGVYNGIEWIVPESGVLVSDIGDELKVRAKAFWEMYTDWQDGVTHEIARRGWIDRRGDVAWGASLAIFAGLAVVGLLVAAVQTKTAGTIPVAGIAIGGPGATSFVLLLLLGLAMPRARKRRSGDAIELAAKWDGFRRYLADFSRIKEAPPASLALWEQFLVYGIVLGVADEVLRAAQLVAPTHMLDPSGIYWIDGSAGPGGGLTMLQLGTLMSGIGRAVAAGAPHGSSSGYGGGFSGGAGSGGGGGGGGAW
jgi:uncharacterized membrane protein